MKSISRLIFFTAAFISVCESCKYDNEDVLYPTNIPQDTNVSYAQRVQPIFNANCNSCHLTGPGANFVSSPYSSVIAYLNTAGKETVFISRIDHTSSPAITWMPQNQPQLSLSDRNAIKTWIAQGKKDN